LRRLFALRQQRRTCPIGINFLGNRMMLEGLWLAERPRIKSMRFWAEQLSTARRIVTAPELGSARATRASYWFREIGPNWNDKNAAYAYGAGVDSVLSGGG
jgi:hypothetical protein